MDDVQCGFLIIQKLLKQIILLPIAIGPITTYKNTEYDNTKVTSSRRYGESRRGRRWSAAGRLRPMVPRYIIVGECKVTNNSAMVQEISELSEREIKKIGRVPEVSVCAQNGN